MKRIMFPHIVLYGIVAILCLMGGVWAQNYQAYAYAFIAYLVAAAFTALATYCYLEGK